MERTSFENLRVYQLSEEIADLVWDIAVNSLRERIEELTPKLSAYINSIGKRQKTTDN